MIWANENKWQDDFDKAAVAFNIPVSLLKAIAAKESSFNPKAYKAEPKIKDASRGLMQVLLRTARSLGFTGKEDELFNPKTSIYYGAYLISENLKQSKGKLDVAIAAYNAGWSKIRPNDAPRKPDNTFVNQEYVNDVTVYNAYFSGKITEAEGKSYVRTKMFPGILTAGVFF